MKCPQCLRENDASATKCSVCEHTFITTQRVRPVVYTSFYAGYFSFRELVTPHLIKVVYIVGACFITAAGVWSILSPETLNGYEDYPILTRFGGIMVFLVGNLVWRMVCEGAILLFSLHEILVSIDNRAKALMLRDESRKQ